jgi:hypothetical protein
LGWQAPSLLFIAALPQWLAIVDRVVRLLWQLLNKVHKAPEELPPVLR